MVRELELKKEVVWSNTGAVGTVVGKFLGSMNLVSALAQITSSQIDTVTVNKRRLVRSVINRTMEMAEALECYAARVEDQILSAKVSLSPTMIARSWDPVITATARAIYDLSEELIQTGASEAGQCGVTPERNQLLLNSIVAFANAIGSEVERDSLAPVSLEAEFARAEEILRSGIEPLLAGVKQHCEGLLAMHRQAMALSKAIPQVPLNP